MPPRANHSKAKSRRGHVSVRRRTRVPAVDFMVQRRPRVEVKQINVSAHIVPFYTGTAGSLLLDVTAIAQGATGATRVGDMATIQKLLFRYSIYNQLGAGTNSFTNSRIIFFQYLADSSVAGKPTIADLFNVSIANSGSTYGTFSAFDIDYARTYRVLWDSWCLTYGAPAGYVATLGCVHHGMSSIPLKHAQRDINFQAGATTGNNHIFLMVTSDQGNATNPEISYNLDVRFTDS